MKRVLILLTVGIMIFAAASLSWADLNQFSGKWTNVDSSTRGITTLEIQVSGTSANVHAWGQCQPSDCDWGTVNATAYTPSVDSRLPGGANALMATFTTNFSQSVVIIKPLGSQLQAEVFTQFTDNSGRSSYFQTYRFNRARVTIPNNNNNLRPIETTKPNLPLRTIPPTIQPANQNLATPVQIAPKPGSVFNYFPRTTNLSWQPVSGASYYKVEVEYYDTAWRPLKTLGTRETSTTIEFVGAQPGRWRVTAVPADVRYSSAPSPWWEFKYLK